MSHLSFIRRLPVLLSTMAALMGCAHWTPSDSLFPSVLIPSDWSTRLGVAQEANQLVMLAQWWQRFDDPLLTQLVQQALQANTSVRSAQAALVQARAQAQVQAAGLSPSVDGSASVQHSRSSGSESNNFQLGIDAGWRPDVFGRIRFGVQASEAETLASEASLGDVQVSLAADVAVNYIQSRGLQQRLSIARSNLTSQRETLQIAQWRLQAGLATSLVTEQARAAAEQTGAQIPSLEAALAQSRHSLAVLTGQPPASLDAVLAETAPIPSAPQDLAFAIPAITVRQRPDIRAAEQQVVSALSRVLQADAARYPDFRISGSLGLKTLVLGAANAGGALARALLASVSVPLIDGGAARAQVRVQEAAFEQARLHYEATVLAALQEVEDALIVLRADRERMVHLQMAADAARNAALLAQQRYSSGLIDFQSVLETQRTLLATQDSVASTLTNVSVDHVRLYKALGGGWQ